MKPITPDLRRSRPPLSASEPLDGIPDGGSRGETELGVVSAANGFPVQRHRTPVCCSQPVAVTVEHLGRVIVLVVNGDVDLHTAPAVRDAIDSALGHRPRRLVVDLSLVPFLNSAGLEVLLAAHRQAAQHTDLRLVATTRAVWRPLQITRLHEQLIIHASRSAAIAAPMRTEDEDRSLPGETRSTPSFESTQS